MGGFQGIGIRAFHHPHATLTLDKYTVMRYNIPLTQAKEVTMVTTKQGSDPINRYKLTTYIDPEIRKKLHLHCVERGISMSEVLRGLINTYLKESK